MMLRTAFSQEAFWQCDNSIIEEEAFKRFWKALEFNLDNFDNDKNNIVLIKGSISKFEHFTNKTQSYYAKTISIEFKINEIRSLFFTIFEDKMIYIDMTIKNTRFPFRIELNNFKMKFDHNDFIKIWSFNENFKDLNVERLIK